MAKTTKNTAPPLAKIYHLLLAEWGPQHWWPGRTRFEVIVGAILTQNTAWTNVEKAIRQMRAARVLTPQRLHNASLTQVAEWIRPVGYYNVKARRLRAFTTLLHTRYNGQLRRLFALDTAALRQELLSVNGIGPETADSILLYAAQRPVFVVDAYTRRFLTRHAWISPNVDYDSIARLFTRQLTADVALYNEYHALIVQLGKTYCRPKPRCAQCPLQAEL